METFNEIAQSVNITPESLQNAKTEGPVLSLAGLSELPPEEQKRRRAEYQKQYRAKRKNVKKPPASDTVESPPKPPAVVPITDNPERAQLNNALSDFSNSLSHLEEFSNNPTTGATPGDALQPTPPPSPQISGRLLLIIIDNIAPTAIVLIVKFVWPSRFSGTKPVDLQLTKQERDDLLIVADEVATLIRLNPVLMLSVSLGSIYLGKLAASQA